jgi:AcrR family transcriptional regulator
MTAVEVEPGRGRASTKKGAQRRDAILTSAADLFRERGFRATSLDDIGAAAGISGPAIYRYFGSKHELLATLIEEAAIAWRVTVDDVLNTDAPPLVTLERLIDAAVALELRNGNLRGVFQHEFRALDDDTRRRLARIDRVTMAEWVHLLCEVRPGLTDDEARAAVLMVDGMLRSVSAMHTGVGRERLAGVMKDMAMGGLLALGDDRPGAPAEPGTPAGSGEG